MGAGPQQGLLTPECRFLKSADPAEMQDWLRRLRLKAYTPGSGYKVADVLAMRTESGLLAFGGVNVECLDHRQSVHSEESAIAFMVTALGKKAAIHEGWVMGAPGNLTAPCADALADLVCRPCGNCRQQIAGLAADDGAVIHCQSLNGQDSPRSIGALLPDAFSFADFDPEASRARAAVRGALAPEDLGAVMERVIRHGPLSREDIGAWLGTLESIDYASRIAQAAVIGLENGFYVAGVKVENAAYTGLSAMQAALGIATTHFGTISVREIYALSRSRRAGDQADLIYPLSLPSLQGLNEFIASRDIPVTLFTAAGASVSMRYDQAAECFSSFAAPAYRIRGGVLQSA